MIVLCSTMNFTNNVIQRDVVERQMNNGSQGEPSTVQLYIVPVMYLSRKEGVRGGGGAIGREGGKQGGSR